MSSVEFVFNDGKDRLVVPDVAVTSFDGDGVSFSMRALSGSRPVPEYEKLCEIVEAGGKMQFCMSVARHKVHDVRRVYIGEAGAGHLEDDCCYVDCLFRNWD